MLFMVLCVIAGIKYGKSLGNNVGNDGGGVVAMDNPMYDLTNNNDNQNSVSNEQTYADVNVSGVSGYMDVNPTGAPGSATYMDVAPNGFENASDDEDV